MNPCFYIHTDFEIFVTSAQRQFLKIIDVNNILGAFLTQHGWIGCGIFSGLIGATLALLIRKQQGMRCSELFLA